MNRTSSKYKQGLTEDQFEALMSKTATDHALFDIARGQRISIDTGGRIAAEFEDQLKEANISPADIMTVLISLEPTGEDDKILLRAEVTLRTEYPSCNKIVYIYRTIDYARAAILLDETINARGVIYFDNGNLRSND